MLHSNILLNSIYTSALGFLPLNSSSLFIIYFSNLSSYFLLWEIVNYFQFWGYQAANTTLSTLNLTNILDSNAIVSFDNILFLNNSYVSENLLTFSPINMGFNFSSWSYMLIIAVFFLLINANSLKSSYVYLSLNTLFQKVSDVSEQEYGSFDDFQILLTYLFYVFSTYVWVVMSWYLLNLYSTSWVFSGLLVMTIFMISIPVKLLIDMGAAFLMYIRGASNSSNLITELVFDTIGVIIVFTRFILQNIRLVLVFLAYFELFEWVVSSVDFNFLTSILSINSNSTSLFSYFGEYSTFFFLTSLLKTVFIYLYHLLHLIIVSFVQIGIYLMISFWLFFFFYTSSNKNSVDSYFTNKR